jgi:hypothetical protein
MWVSVRSMHNWLCTPSEMVLNHGDGLQNV